MTAYSVVGIVNLGLGRIGQPKINSLTEGSTAANQANAVWPYIRDEVLSRANWVFAKRRVALSQNATTPAQGFDFAYTLPPDFIRVFRDSYEDPSAYPTGVIRTTQQFGELSIQGGKYSYVIEALADGKLCLFSDYDDSSESLVLQYVRREENPARYSPLFISAAGFRMGAELAPVLTESAKKFETMMSMYEGVIRKARALNNSGDFIRDEVGSDDWLNAGR